MPSPAGSAEPSTGAAKSTATSTPAPAPAKRRRLGLFDATGLVAVLAFVTMLWVDRSGLAAVGEEVALDIDPQALAEGFREGVVWHGLYRDGTKVGFSRTQRQRLGDRFATTHTLVLPGPDGTTLQQITVRTELDDRFVLAHFEAKVVGGPLAINATGDWDGEAVAVTMEGLPTGPQSLRISLPEPPQMDGSFLPVVTRTDVRPGDRFSFSYFDPLSAVESRSTVEVIGTETIDVLAERTEALHLRQTLAGQALEVWVNPLGEVLKQTLPGGLMAVRESEAEATWGVMR